MPRLPVVSGKDVIKALSKIGYEQKRTKGSHVILAKELEEGKNTVVVPLHRELAKGTLNSIIKQAELSREEFLELM